MTFICSRNQNYSNECGLMFLCRRNLYFSYNTLMINMYFFSLNASHWLHQTPHHKEIENQIASLIRQFTLGLFVWIVLWMLIRTRKIVTRSVIRPGMISGFTRKLWNWSVEDNCHVTSINLTLSMRRPQRVPREGNMSRCRMTSSAWAEAGTRWCCNSFLNRNIKCIYKETQSYFQWGQAFTSLMLLFQICSCLISDSEWTTDFEIRKLLTGTGF